jgi:hypothetical protein
MDNIKMNRGIGLSGMDRIDVVRDKNNWMVLMKTEMNRLVP